jgi:hypothetical protein
MRRIMMMTVSGALVAFGTSLSVQAAPTQAPEKQSPAPVQAPVQAPEKQAPAPVQAPTQKLAPVQAPTQAPTQKHTQAPCQSPVQKGAKQAGIESPSDRSFAMARSRRVR